MPHPVLLSSPPESLGLSSPRLYLLFHKQHQSRLGLRFSVCIGSHHDRSSEIRHVLDVLDYQHRHGSVGDLLDHPRVPNPFLLIREVVELNQ